MPVTYERHVLSEDRWTTEQTTPGDHKRRALIAAVVVPGFIVSRGSEMLGGLG